MAFVLAFLSICMSSLLSALDLTSISTALPTMVSELEKSSFFNESSLPPLPTNLASINETQICNALVSENKAKVESFIWIGTAFALAGTAILPWTGVLAQIWGRKPIFLLSLLLFAIGSAVCGSAQSMTVLIVGRVIQGLGDGGIISLSEILIADMVPLSERGTYEGLLGCVWALASAIGPLVGGVFSDRLTWRWLFYLNLPISLLAILLVAFCLKTRSPDLNVASKLGMMDWVGNITIIISLVGLTLALTWGGADYAWATPQVLVPLVIGSILFVSFFVYEFTWAKNPSVPIELFSNMTSSSAYLGTFLHGLVVMAVIYVLPSYFQACFGVSVLKSSIMVLPLALTIAPFAIIMAVTIEVTQEYRIQNYVGWMLTVIGLGLMTMLNDHSKTAAWVGYQIPLGIGLGTNFVAPQFPVLASIQPTMAAQGLAIFTFVSSLGQTMGITIGSTVLQNSINRNLFRSCEKKLKGSSTAAVAIERVHKLPPEIRKKIRKAFSTSFRSVWIATLPFAVLGLASCFFLKHYKLHDEVDEQYSAIRDRKPVDGSDVEKR
ncbi:iron permease [Violaceomyces palustris]|uniref:Iron permease n=1 Tax=Violaceomyces palustris TaxID=1673888 RepID=A0ACD0P2D2_9BASI|nr:iron permease [Violaceomyces palustris]